MRTPVLFLSVPVILLGSAGLPAAQGVVTGGSSDTMIDGKPAGRVGDHPTNGGSVVEGAPNVFLTGKPAAIVGGRNGCGGVVVGGSSNVFIDGKPAATAGSAIGDCKGH